MTCAVILRPFGTPHSACGAAAREGLLFSRCRSSTDLFWASSCDATWGKAYTVSRSQCARFGLDGSLTGRRSTFECFSSYGNRTLWLDMLSCV